MREGSFDRVMASMAGGAVGAFFVAVVESARGARVWPVPIGAMILGDAAVLTPLGMATGLGLAVAAIFLDPGGSFRARAFFAHLLGARSHLGAQMTGFFLLAPALVLTWIIACACEGREAFASGLPDASGTEVAVVAVVGLIFAGAALVGALPVLAGQAARAVTPSVALVCGVSYALALSAIGVRLGDTSGQGPAPIAILGVLTRPELDVSPVFSIMAVVACAWLAGRLAASPAIYGSYLPLGAAIAAIGATSSLLIYEARALSVDPRAARAIETTAPLGRLALALARKMTDGDRDGASALFGGGDCDDSDPRRSPSAFDVPGNGIDEDCSGADRPLVRVPTAAAQATAPAPRAVPNDMNLVLVTVDTLRIDLGFMGYPRPVSPNLDALAARSTVFERGYSMASYTGKSVGPTLIGKYPSECFRDGAHFDTYFPENTFLAERLRSAGFRTMGAASHWYFKPKYGLPQGIDTWDMSALPAEYGRDADSSVTSEPLTDAAIRLLSDPANTAGRFFFWVHYFDPHANYVKHPEAPDFRAGAKSWAKPAYDGEVWFTDHHIGRLLDFIDAQSWAERTVIVVTADHGEAFEEHGMSWHGVDLWEPLVRVPLIVYVPGTRPHRVKEKRSLVDVVPTALELMGLSAPGPAELSGVSMAQSILSPDAPVEERDVFIDMPAGPQVSQHRALIHGSTPGRKLMAEGGPVYLLFDLAADPGELNDLSRDREALAQMKAYFEDMLGTLRVIRVDPAPYQAR